MTAHTPQPPTDALTGRWLVERAEMGQRTAVRDRPAAIWALTVRHIDSNVVDHVRCVALSRTTFTVGQEINGHVETRWDGPWFKRDRPAVSRRGI